MSSARGSEIGRRRSLGLGLCGAVGSLLLPHRDAYSDDDDKFFPCATQEPEQQTAPQIIPYSGSGNQTVVTPLLGGETTLTPYGLGCVADRWRKEDSLSPSQSAIVLGVAFLDGTADQRAFVQKVADEWISDGIEQLIRFNWNVAPSSARIRISFTRGVLDWSYIGRTSIKTLPTQQTMNLHHHMVESTIRHEFGHALGLRHEHQHPDLRIEWNEDVVFSHFKEIGWSEAQVRTAILEPARREFICVGDSSPNPKSVMGYFIRKGWAKNYSTYPSETITDRDRACVAGIYRA